MHAFPAYDLERILRLTIRNYLALRRHVERLRNLDLADGIRAAFYAQTKDPYDIIKVYDPQKPKS
jgi:hypothetical protein